MELGNEILTQILSLTASVALTFPLTIIIGIPLYYAIVRMLG